MAAGRRQEPLQAGRVAFFHRYTRLLPSTAIHRVTPVLVARLIGPLASQVVQGCR
jgi:hypothetical protein